MSVSILCQILSTGCNFIQHALKITSYMHDLCVVISLLEISLSSNFCHFGTIFRLLSWGGKQIEPVGADYILHKLGFKHARTTIPKWIQRGVMDPSDIAVSFIVREMLKMMDEGSDDEKETKKTEVKRT